MKIAIVIERYAPGAGGAERSTAEVAAELRARGHEVTILTGHAREKKSTNGIIIRSCPTGSPKGITRLLLFRRWVRRAVAGRGKLGPFDASLSVTSAVPAMVVQPRAGLIPDLQSRSIAWRRDAGSRFLRRAALRLNFRQWTLRWLEGRTFRDPVVRHIACISGMVQRDCRKHYPDSASKLVHICNAVKPLVVDPVECARWRAQLRQEWGCRETDTVFYLPSLDSRRKGLTPLLHALALLRKEAPSLGVLLVLSGRVHDVQKKLIGELGLSSLVHQTGFHSDLRRFYAAADVTVLPTYYDSFGRVVIESLLLGRPAITTAFAGAAELVMPADGAPRGRVVADPDDVPALSRALRDLCDPAERERCMAALGNVLDDYLISRHVGELLKLFSACGTPPAA